VRSKQKIILITGTHIISDNLYVLVVICAAHTPDNSFLGFIVPREKLINVTEKENYALIIGKERRYLLVRLVYLFSVNRK